MSRGWESNRGRTTGTSSRPEADAQESNADIAERKRRMQTLEMQRERILSERTSNLTVARRLPMRWWSDNEENLLAELG